MTFDSAQNRKGLLTNWRMILGTLVAALLLAIAAPAALAAYDITGFDAEIVDQAGDPETQAGIHPFKVRNVIDVAGDAMGASGSIKDIIVDTPAGFVGNPRDIPTCERALLVDTTGAGCPPASQVGTLTIKTPFADMPAPVFNMEPPPGVPAQFGATFLGWVTVYMEASVRPEDNGIRIRISDTAAMLPLLQTSLELWGVPGDPIHDANRGWTMFGVCTFLGGSQPCPAGTGRIPFLTNPTDCSQSPPVTRLRTNSWQSPDVWVERTFEHPPFEGCEKLDYRPGLAVEPQRDVAGAPSGYAVELTQDLTDSPDALATSDLKRAEVTLPEGVTVNPAAATGLVGCSPAQIGLASADAPTCPRASRIGTATIDTPLLDRPMVGPIFQAAPHDNPFGSLLAMYLAPSGDGVQLKLAGEVSLDPATGRVKATFDDNPRLPFSKLKLDFNGGERAILVNPPTCGTHRTTGAFTPWAGGSANAGGAFEILSGCGRAGTFVPSMAAGSASPTAGAASPFTLRIAREAGQQDLSAMSFELPTGLLAKVGRVPLCPDAAADAGTCGDGSRVGSVQVAVGAGATPLWLPEPGKAPTAVHLSGPYRGAPYSLSFEIPAQAGPLDLGTVVVRAPLHVDRSTAQVTATVAQSRVYTPAGTLEKTIEGGLPTMIAGIPLAVQEIRVLVDRPDFTVNPTDCSPKQVGAVVGSAKGASVELSNRFQVADCAALGFAPRIGLRLLGRKQTRTGRHPGLKAVVTQPAGQAGIARAAVRLPRSLALDADNARALCEFEDGTKPDLENHCPATSVIGRARAVTPLLDKPLAGNAYFVKNVRTDPRTGNRIRTLPMIVLALRGDIAINLRGTSSTARGGNLVTTFARVPDAPISRFALRIHGGSNGILAVTRTRRSNIDLCKTGRQIARAALRGHNGKQVAPPILVRKPCARRKTRG